MRGKKVGIRRERGAKRFPTDVEGQISTYDLRNEVKNTRGGQGSSCFHWKDQVGGKGRGQAEGHK